MILSKLKGLSKDTLIYGVGGGLGKMVNIVMLPILSRIFAPSDYGIIDLLIVSYAFVQILLRFGIPSGIQRHYYLVEGMERRELISSSIYIIVLISFVAAVIIFSGMMGLKNHMVFDNIDIFYSIIILSFCLPIELLFNCLVLLLRLQRKAVIFSIANIVRVIMTPFLTYIMVAPLSLGIKGFFIAKIITISVISAGLFIILCKEFSKTIKLSVFIKILTYSLPGCPGLIIKQLMNLLPRYILVAYAPLTAVGLFGIGFRISTVMKIFVEAFNRSWNPFAYANSGKSDEKKIYEIVFKFFSVGLISVSIVLSVFSREFLHILTPEKYHDAYMIVPGLVFYFAVSGIVLIFSTLLYTNDKVKWTSYLNLIQIAVFVPLGILLADNFNALGIVVAMDISVCIYFLMYMNKTLKVFYFKIPFVKLLIILTVAAIGVFWLNDVQIGLFGVMSKSLFVIAHLIFSLMLITDNQEKRQIKNLLVGSK
jgi:O-antigen/teichoic acid export membrane protein